MPPPANPVVTDTARSTTVRQAVFDALQRIAPECSPGALNPAIALRDQVDLDSMDWLNFFSALNEKLGMGVAESDYRKLATLNDLLGYLEKRHRTKARYPATLVGQHRFPDGMIVTIRPIRADDADRIRSFLTASSEESRYRRFQKWVGTPSNSLVHFLTNVDYDECLALVCTVPREADEDIVGEARYIVNRDGKSCEFGLMIEDAWCKTGVAGLMMEALIQGARERGLAEMEGMVLATNAPMLRFAQALGFEIEPIKDDRTTLRVYRRLQPGRAAIPGAKS
jgi:RimJ/RimL family protein N-acetyltransferase